MDKEHNEQEGWRHSCEQCGAYLFSTRTICYHCEKELSKYKYNSFPKKEEIVYTRDIKIDIGFSP